MTSAPYRAIGGSVVTDHGVIALAEARALYGFYAREAAGTSGLWRRIAAERSQALVSAAEDAERWRRAAGWTEPDEADQA
jgi:hypothetical protein